MCCHTSQIGEIIGASLIFIVGIANLIVTIRQNRKSIFISSITQKRFKYINEYRNNISAFCALAESSDSNKRKKLKKLKYQILLYLNPEYKDWDGKIIKLINDIANEENIKPNKIEKLITISQFNLMIEWEGAQMESKKGILDEVTKKMLRRKYSIKYDRL